MSANWAWSLAASSTAKWLGTTVRPRTSTVRSSSISRTSRRPSSTGRRPGAEQPGEHALDHPLQPALEPLQSHGPSSVGRCYAATGSWDGTGSPESGVPLPLAASCAASLPRFHSGEWRNWQTRWLQVPVSVRTWGFKSPLAHASRWHGFERSPTCSARTLGAWRASGRSRSSSPTWSGRPSCARRWARTRPTASGRRTTDAA